MKYFILTFVGFVILFVFSACGLIYTTKGAPTKKQKELVEQYGGLYVFDKKLREEIMQSEKERRGYMNNWFKTHEFFTKDDLIQLDKTHPKLSLMGINTIIKLLVIMKNNLNPTTKKSKIYGVRSF